MCAWVLPGCVSRALDDELEEVCEDHCAVRFECGYQEGVRTFDECVTECVSLVKVERDECVAAFELTRCQAQLSCDDLEAYTAGIDQYARTAMWPRAFPCRHESMEMLRICYPD